jgi:uncharacterized protein (TIGR03083 family)
VVALADVPKVPQSRLAEAWETVGSALVELLRLGRTNPDQPVVGLTWTVSQLGAHLVEDVEIIIDVLRGKGSPFKRWDSAYVAKMNQSYIDAILKRGIDLADQLESALDEWRPLITSDDLPPTVPYHADQPLPPLRAAACVFTDCLVHGYELARALGQPWPIDPEHVDLGMRGITAIVDHMVTERARGFTATYQLRLRGQGTYTFRFEDGRLTVGGNYDGPVDCRISADPGTYLLVAAGRLGPIRPALTGRMVVYGRRPWLGARFSQLLAAP